MARNSLKNIFAMIDLAKESFLPEQSFLNDLKRSIELTETKNARRPSKTYKPSSMQCIRNMYYQVTGKEPDETIPNATLVGICESGTDRHLRIQKAVAEMKSNDIDCEYIDVETFVKSRNLDCLEIVSKGISETKLYHKNLNMSFMCDGIIRYKGKYYILEIKTETSHKWIERKEVAEDHYNQATAYSIAFNLPDVIFLYVNRDTCDMKAFLLTVTDDMKQDLIGKIEECDNYVKIGQCPPNPENVSKKACTYCDYRNSCNLE